MNVGDKLEAYNNSLWQMMYSTPNSMLMSNSRKKIESQTGHPSPKLMVKMIPSRKLKGLMELKLKFSVSGADKKDNKQNCNISRMADITEALILYLVTLFTISVVKVVSIFPRYLHSLLQTKYNFGLLSNRCNGDRH